jgi:uncharacterized protein
MTKKNGKQDQAGSSRPGPSSSKRRGKVTPKAWIALTLMVGLAIGFFLGRKHPAPPPPPMENATQAARAGALEHRVSLVEEALHKALKAQQADLASLQVVSTEPREHSGLPYTFTTLRLPQVDGHALHELLVKELASLVPSAKLTRVSPDVWDIEIDGLPTHRLNLPPEAHPEAQVKPAVKGRLAIVIDDMGEDVAMARELTKLGVPVAFSIWPDSSHREDVLKIAKSAGREILIHLPMQPKGYPKVDPGQHPLLVTMTADQIKAVVRRAVTRVPGAIGLNNHMGSKFTEYDAGMRAALATMHENGLFFLDSRTTAGTVGVLEAKRLGVRVYQRDVFLDNEQNDAAILKQLRQGETLAREHGHAIVIGHPHKQTLAAIKQWLKQKDPAVHVVTLSALPPR